MSDRIQRLQELYTTISPLRETRQFLNLKLYLKQATPEDESELNKVSLKLAPLEQEFDSKRIRYWVKYIGEFYDVNSKSHYMSDARIEQFLFYTDCDVETLNERSPEIEGFHDLLNEITETLYYHRFSKFEILDIKKIKQSA